MKISSFKKIDLSKNISEKIGVSVSLSKKLTEDLLEILSNKIIQIIENKDDYFEKKKNMKIFSYQNSWNKINEKIIKVINEN